MNEVLILGGTGAMGSYLVSVLKVNYHVVVTSRKKKCDSENVTYLQGNAHNISFLKEILCKKYDAIIDFMHYTTAEFKQRHEMLLNSCNQLVFISSARVYADSGNSLITEKSSRLLDVTKDMEFLETDDYALAKARQEDILVKGKKKNWTIVRPYMTYFRNRLDLGFYSKELWLYRVLKGRKILFPKDVAAKYTTLTYGNDVANGIAALLGKEETLGHIFHITSNKSYKWYDVIKTYQDTLKKCGLNMQVEYIETPLFKEDYIYKYDRLYNRRFDNQKIQKYIDIDTFTDTLIGLEQEIVSFVRNPVFNKINWDDQSDWDNALKERTSLSEISSKKDKIKYLLHIYLFSNMSYKKCRKAIKHLIKNYN